MCLGEKEIKLGQDKGRGIRDEVESVKLWLRLFFWKSSDIGGREKEGRGRISFSYK